MKRVKENLLLLPVAIVIGIILYAISLLGCNSIKKERPYEAYFKRVAIKSIHIEPIIVDITIDTTLDQSTVVEATKLHMQKTIERIADENKKSYLSQKNQYEHCILINGKKIADDVYKNDMLKYKRIYENAQNGIVVGDHLDFFKRRIKKPPVMQQLTIKYRLQENGPLIVETYRTDIEEGDTALFKCKTNLVDYIKYN